MWYGGAASIVGFAVWATQRAEDGENLFDQPCCEKDPNNVVVQFLTGNVALEDSTKFGEPIDLVAGEIQRREVADMEGLTRTLTSPRMRALTQSLVASGKISPLSSGPEPEPEPEPEPKPKPKRSPATQREKSTEPEPEVPEGVPPPADVLAPVWKHKDTGAFADLKPSAAEIGKHELSERRTHALVPGNFGLTPTLIRTLTRLL